MGLSLTCFFLHKLIVLKSPPVTRFYVLFPLTQILSSWRSNISVSEGIPVLQIAISMSISAKIIAQKTGTNLEF